MKNLTGSMTIGAKRDNKHYSAKCNVDLKQKTVELYGDKELFPYLREEVAETLSLKYKNIDSFLLNVLGVDRSIMVVKKNPFEIMGFGISGCLRF